MEFVNAVNAVNGFLRGVLPGVRFVTVVPDDPRPDRFVRAIRTGGFRRDRVTDVARITYECWNTNKAQAERDAQTLRVALDSLPGATLAGAKVHRVNEVAAPSDSPDAQTGHPRYVMSFELHMRGTQRKATNG